VDNDLERYDNLLLISVALSLKTGPAKVDRQRSNTNHQRVPTSFWDDENRKNPSLWESLFHRCQNPWQFRVLFD